MGAVVKFIVIDPRTERYPNMKEIALSERWAEGMGDSLPGFALTENGLLLVIDTDGNVCTTPDNRFIVQVEQTRCAARPAEGLEW